MVSNAAQSKNYKVNSMIFQNKKIFNLINHFNKTLTPLFEITKGPFCDEAIPNSNFRKNENEYVKLLMKLTDLFEDLEQIGPIKINHLDESGFQEAFPNIMHMFYEQTEVFDSCPHDIDGTINRENISPEDNNLYSLSESLWNLGVCPIEF